MPLLRTKLLVCWFRLVNPICLPIMKSFGFDFVSKEFKQSFQRDNIISSTTSKPVIKILLQTLTFTYG